MEEVSLIDSLAELLKMPQKWMIYYIFWFAWLIVFGAEGGLFDAGIKKWGEIKTADGCHKSQKM